MGYYVVRCSNTLQHHGILGMKWGVWNDETRARRLGLHKEKNIAKEETEEDKKNGLTERQKKIIKNGAIAAASILAVAGGTYLLYSAKRKGLNTFGMMNYRYGTIKDLSSLSSDPQIISKGTKFQRISSKSVEDYIKDGRIYVSHLKEDNAIYKDQMPRFIERWYREGTVDEKTSFVHSLKFKRDIKIASDKDVAEAYMKVNKVDKVDEGHFMSFISDLVDRDNNLVKQFVDDLKNKGFDGIKDYHDADSFTTDPLYLFNVSEILESDSSHKLGKIERFINVITS